MADDCARCGALVINTETHRQWHKATGDALTTHELSNTGREGAEYVPKLALVEVDSAKLADLVEDTETFNAGGDSLYFAGQLLAKWAAMEFRPAVPDPTTLNKPLYEMLGLAQRTKLDGGASHWLYADPMAAGHSVSLNTLETRPVYARRVRWTGSHAVGLDLVCRPLDMPQNVYVEHGRLELMARRVWT